jgi:predicted nucleic acid-binding protein
VTRGVLWDSSAILALLDADDADHARAVTVARDIAAERRPSFMTNYIEAESHALLLRKLGRALAREWLLTGGLTVVPALPSEEQKAKEILVRHTDKDWTLCDAIPENRTVLLLRLMFYLATRAIRSRGLK